MNAAPIVEDKHYYQSRFGTGKSAFLAIADILVVDTYCNGKRKMSAQISLKLMSFPRIHSKAGLMTGFKKPTLAMNMTSFLRSAKVNSSSQDQNNPF